MQPGGLCRRDNRVPNQIIDNLKHDAFRPVGAQKVEKVAARLHEVVDAVHGIRLSGDRDEEELEPVVVFASVANSV